MLISGAEAIDAMRRMRPHGVTGDLRIEWGKLMAFKRSFTDPVPRNREADFARAGIDAFHGHCRFTGPNSVAVAGVAEELKGRFILIATGARPDTLNITGENLLMTSERFLELKALPPRLVLVGGGYIAAEFSHIAARAGAKVTVLQRHERMLPAFDADLVGWLMEKFAELGIEVRTRTSVQKVEKGPEGFNVHMMTDRGPQVVTGDCVVHAAGRVPDVDTLDLAAGKVEAEHGHLKLNEFLQSVSNPGVYAAGDAAVRGPPLTPVSSHDGKVVASNLLHGNRQRPDYRGVPSVAFTIPPIAAVGLGEDAARASGLKFRVTCERVPDWYSAVRLAESVYGFKTLVEEGTERILGAHIVGPHADEVINLFGLAIRHNLTVEALKDTVFAYPTGASDLGSMI
jgi:glutathione reductase (NADPH)